MRQDAWMRFNKLTSRIGRPERNMELLPTRMTFAHHVVRHAGYVLSDDDFCSGWKLNAPHLGIPFEGGKELVSFHSLA